MWKWIELPEYKFVVASWLLSKLVDGGFSIPGLNNGGCGIEATVGELEAVEVELEAVVALNVAKGGAVRFNVPEWFCAIFFIIEVNKNTFLFVVH